MNDVLVLLFTAGGAAFLTALVSGLRALRSQRAESEEAIIKRLNDSANTATRDADNQRSLREKAEAARDLAREQRDRAQEEVSRLRRIIISAGLPDPHNDAGRN